MITIERILGFALRERVVLDQIGEALRSDLVTANPYYRRIVEFVEDFASERRKLPLQGDYQLWLSSLPEAQRNGTSEALGRLQAQTFHEFDPEFFAEQVLETLRETATKTALARMNSIQNLNPDSFRELADQVDGIEAGTIAGMANLRDLDLWVKPPSPEEFIPTGFQKLDRTIGGWGKELWVICANTGVGKSIWLQNCGATALQKGKRVVHISLELGLRPLIYRYYRQIARMSKSEFISHPKEARKRLDHWFQFAGGELFLLEFPAYSMNPRTLQKILSRLERLSGPLDMIILDYLELLILPPGMQSRSGYEDQGKITHMIRSFCPAFDTTVLSATQAVKVPKNKGRLVLQDVADSYGKVRGSDGFLALVQTEEEEENHMGRLGVLKSRDSGGRKEFPIYVNKDLAYMADLDHPSTKRLMERLGHVIKQPKEENNGLPIS